MISLVKHEQCKFVRKRKKRNKAGYTAISCGRVGRGRNARFPTFRLVLTDRRTDRRTDKASYRVACPQLKRLVKHLGRNGNAKSFKDPLAHLEAPDFVNQHGCSAPAGGKGVVKCRSDGGYKFTSTKETASLL